MTVLAIMQAGPLATIQDAGRPGMLGHGIAASGPMDRRGYSAAALAGAATTSAIELTAGGLSFAVRGDGCGMGYGGGDFVLSRNSEALPWPGRTGLSDGDVVEIRAGSAGNYGYLRFTREIDVPQVMGSRATNATVGIGGLEGRALRAGDRIGLMAEGGTRAAEGEAGIPEPLETSSEPIRFVWGIHAGLFPQKLRQRFAGTPFRLSARMDRMGIRLEDRGRVFAEQRSLTLVSDAVVAGDIQILGDGTPIVLMRDHQPTGGYPRIGTVIDADTDRLAQIRPGKDIVFQPVSVETAHRALKG